MRITCEVCVESVAGARAAAAGGADRIELCSALVEGGLTPSVGLLARTRAVCRLTTMVMLRPRGGDFCYSDDEVEQMRIDLEVLREHGADGFVLGFLEPDGSIDERRTRAFVAAAAPLPVTFHRAFDWTPHPFAALERLIDCGVKRVLTSGQAAAAIDALPVLASLVERAGGRIAVVPGCGIGPDEVERVLAATGAREIHFSAGGTVPSRAVHRNPLCPMSAPGRDDSVVPVTDPELVAATVRAARRYRPHAAGSGPAPESA